MHPIDHTGARFGRLTALKIEERRKGVIYWRFRCDCGVEKSIRIGGVTNGAVRSCGCLHLERCQTGKNRVRHGYARKGKVNRLHSIWRGMLKRCNPANNIHAIERYAARGITVCDEWQEFIPFKDWAEANGYADNLSLERDNNDGAYSPENCRWATWKDQCRNRRTTNRIEVAGTSKSLAEWLEQTGVGPSAYHSRIKRGWPIERALGLI